MTLVRKFDENTHEVTIDEIACLIAQDTNLPLLELRDRLDELSEIYYLYDPENRSIPAIIVGGFGGTLTTRESTFSKPYPIHHLWYDRVLAKDDDHLDDKLVYLVRDFCKDKNWWAVEYCLPAYQKEDMHIIKAFRTNSFIYNTPNILMRRIPFTIERES